ncbi:MAG: cardiolipin synthase ClsB [Nitrosomonadales bacterium]|nr:cardiolipin synthase ClsB [Nitrosomonadales bacterium]
MHHVAGNDLVLLQNGAEYFPLLCADIDAAQQSVYLETYIFAADGAGRMVADALQRAALRGVVVRVLLDGYGSAELPQPWVEQLQQAGVQVQWFRREIYRFRMRRHRLRRLHRKLVVIDGRVAFVGGINIIDDVSAHEQPSAPRLDYAVRVQGALAGQVHAVMRRLWRMVSWASLRRRGKDIRGQVSTDGASQIMLLLRDNLRHRRDIERAYLKAIAGAQREVLIANAYFLPGRAFRRTLKQAVRRGVRVVLLLQGKVEYRLQHYATHALYEQLLAAGIEIYEYQPGYLHAKVAVVDGQWATVGSSNIDPFSLLLAREANLVVRDAGFAGGLRASLFDAIERDALHIDATHWRRLNFVARALMRLSYGAVRMLVGVLGRRRH